MFGSVRLRLTLWYVCVLAFALVAFGALVYGLLRRGLYDRVDSGLRAETRAVAAAFNRELAAGASAQAAAVRAQEERFFPRQATAVYDAAGGLVAERPTRSGKRARLPRLELLSPDDTYFYTVLDEEEGGNDGRRVAVKQIKSEVNGAVYFYAASQPLDPVAEQLESARRSLYVAVPLALAVAAAGGWFLARRSLAPVVEMSERARQIGAGNLGERLPVANPGDELGRLASTFNELLARLGAAFEQQLRFMADASHELRTPLTVIRTASDVALERGHRTEEEYRRSLQLVSEQARRLTRLVEDMFTLARADAGQPALRPVNFYLDELVGEAARAAAVLGAERSVRVTTDCEEESPFRGDEGLVRQLVLNLLDNAVKHTPPGGTVSVGLARENSHFALSVADTGEGIPEAARPHVFERFYRADKSRSRAEGGAGLGLSIARWVAEAHGGSLELADTGPRGSTFVARLPARNGL